MCQDNLLPPSSGWQEICQGETRSPLVQHKAYNRNVIQRTFVERKVGVETKKSSVAH